MQPHVHSSPSPETSTPFCAWCSFPILRASDKAPDADAHAPPVHRACLNRRTNDALWRCAKGQVMEMLRPTYVALGESQEAENIIFRLYPRDATPKIGFETLNDLTHLVTRHCPNHTEAVDALRQARIALMTYLG